MPLTETNQIVSKFFLNTLRKMESILKMKIWQTMKRLKNMSTNLQMTVLPLFILHQNTETIQCLVFCVIKPKQTWWSKTILAQLLCILLLNRISLWASISYTDKVWILISETLKIVLHFIGHALQDLKWLSIIFLVLNQTWRLKTNLDTHLSILLLNVLRNLDQQEM